LLNPIMISAPPIIQNMSKPLKASSDMSLFEWSGQVIDFSIIENFWLFCTRYHYEVNFQLINLKNLPLSSGFVLIKEIKF
jgi:hypothetical protein